MINGNLTIHDGFEHDESGFSQEYLQESQEVAEPVHLRQLKWQYWQRIVEGSLYIPSGQVAVQNFVITFPKNPDGHR